MKFSYPSSSIIPQVRIRRGFRFPGSPIILLMGLTLSHCGNAEKTSDHSKQDRPHVRIVAEISGETIGFAITVPDNHHAYLDRGLEGNLIPVTFDWGEMKEPEPVSVPIGMRDKSFKATVLRGSGEFIFRSPTAKDYSGRKVRVLSQICDDIQGICYRPEYTDVLPEMKH